MQKIFSILLSLLILLQSLNITIEDVVHFEVLLDHAEFHQDEYGDSFVAFLTSHYFEINKDSNEHKEHKNLPFKNKIENFTQVNLACLNETLVFETKETTQPKFSTTYFYTETYSYSNKTSIFQPPRTI